MRWLGGLAACAFIAAAQQTDEVRVSAHVYTPPLLRLTAQAQLVQLDVVVRDSHGRAVGGLKHGDFEILDEGRPRAIAAFSVETRGTAPVSVPAAGAAAHSIAAPAATAPPAATRRSIVLFFDDLHTSGAELQRTQFAARRFVKDGLEAGTRAAVYAASEGMTLDFTPDAGALTSAIDKLRAHQRMSENGLSACPRIPPYQAYLIANHVDPAALGAAILEAKACSAAAPTLAMRGTDPVAAEVQTQAEQTWQQARTISLTSFDAIENAMALLAKAPGTRVLLMVSTGFLSGMLDTARDAAIDRAIHGGIVINALDAKGLWSEPPARPFGENPQTALLPGPTFIFEATSTGTRNDALNAVMAEFAASTGGLFFHNSNDLVGGFDQLGAAPEITYLLAFRPDTEGVAGKYHKLKVRLTAGTAGHVQARPGYFAPAAPQGAPPGDADADRAQRQLDQEAMAADTLAEIPVELTGRLGKTDKGDPTLSLTIHVDLAKLPFTARNGRQIQKLAFIGALMDARGNLVAAKEGAMDLALKAETFARLTASGVNAALTLSAPPGPYRVRVVVEEAGGRMAALNQTVEIPK
ncbi:MAG: VWA domain-containing protein [Bryobacteraceae bacterium]